MLPHRFPRPIRLGLYALASCVLLYLCLAPKDRLFEPPGTSDKVEHAIAWFILTALGYLLAPRRRWAIPAYAVALGAAVEVLQRLFGFGRHGDLGDFAVDVLGVAVAVAAWEAVRRARRPEAASVVDGG